MQDRLQGVTETLIGTAVATVPLWSRILDDIVRGAQAAAAIGGAVIAIHGVVRIFRKRARRGEDMGQTWKRK